MMQQNQQMMQVMQQQIQQNAQSQQQWAAAMQQGQGAHQQHPPPPIIGNPAFREYNRNHPSEFNGEGEPQEAKRWVKHMEKIFRMADCIKEEKVIFATNQFRGAAEDLWETAQHRMVTDGIEMNWENFKKVMLEKYLSLSYKVRKEQEFLQLKQDNVSVTEFTKKFEELSQYKHALRGEIYAVVSQQRLTNFDDIVHNSLEAERGFDKAAREGYGAFERKKGNLVDKHHEKLKPRGSPQKGKRFGSPKIYPQCKNCGKNHSGDCRMGSDNCFACGQAGHFVADCPNRKNKGKNVNTTMSKGRVYSLDGKKAQANEDLIGGMCFLGQNRVRVLFDCGATCSFISFQCVETLQLTVSPLDPPMIVTTATDEGIVADRVCENCPITISSKTYYIDLVCLPMKQLDVILGMDWLSANHVYIGCSEKSIYMPTSSTVEGVALSRLLKHTYQMVQFICAQDNGFYVMLTVASESDISPNDIPIVSEYLDVLPSDINSLPPEREIEFSIDLIPGAELVSVAPYRMSPLEIKELKSQLEEFI